MLVDVAFAGCNWADTQIRTGIYPHPFTYPLVLGFEISGTVSKLGPGVSGVKVGDRVATFVEKGGAYAEKAVAAANILVPLPDAIPFDVGAALVIQPMTGYHMLHTLHRLEPGETVLINAIGGGRRPVHHAACRESRRPRRRYRRYAGEGKAGPGIRRRAGRGHDERGFREGRARLHQRPRRRSRHRFAGATMLDRTFNVVRKLGHIISIGEAEGQPFKNIRERILPRSQTFTRFHLGHIDPGSAAWKNGVEHVLGGVRDGWLKVPIAGVFPMSEAAEMHRRIELRQAAGKLLLAIGG